MYNEDVAYKNNPMVTSAQNRSHNITAAELSKQVAYQRNLHMARLAQQKNEQQMKQRHLGNIATSVGTSQQKPLSNNVQKKQQLREARTQKNQRAQQKKSRAMVSAKTKEAEKIVKKYESTSWTLLYVAAIFDDLADILTIPVLSTFLSACSSLYINCKLWSIGAKEARTKMRLKRAGLLVLDLIPIINWFPVSTWIIYSAQKEEKARVKKAKKIIQKNT